jgi:hypothetical protein
MAFLHCVRVEKPENLPPRDPQQLGSFIDGDVLCHHVAQNMHPIDLGYRSPREFIAARQTQEAMSAL